MLGEMCISWYLGFRQGEMAYIEHYAEGGEGGKASPAEDGALMAGEIAFGRVGGNGREPRGDGRERRGGSPCYTRPG